MLLELAWLLPWCWFINMSFSVYGHVVRSHPLLARLDRSIDDGYCLPDGHRLLGDSSTWGGLLLACILGISGELLFPGHYLLVLALLVCTGHMAGSFLKRRLGMRSGAFLPLIDHIDYLLLAGTVFLLMGYVSLATVSVAILATLVLTPLVTYGAFRLGMRTHPL